MHIGIGNIIGRRGGQSGIDGSPTSLIVTAQTDTTITLSWTIGSTNQDGHRIYISTDGSTYTEKGTVTGTTSTYQATELTSITHYYFKVVAYNGSSESDPSNIVNDYTLNYFTVTATGNGSAVSTMRMAFNTATTLYATGDLKFCASDGSAEATTTSYLANTDHTRYLKIASGSGKILYPERNVYRLGTSGFQFWTSSTNAPVVSGSMSNAIAVIFIRIQTNTTIAFNITNFTSLVSITHLFNPSSITGSITGLTSLSELTISGTNTLTGSITGLTSLVSITSDGSSTLSGSIAGLTSATKIYIGGTNNLTGSVEALTSLAYLRILYGTNDIYGSIAGLTNLYYCSVANNHTLSYPNVTNLTRLCNFSISNAVLSEANINQLLADCYLNRNETKGSADRIFDLAGANSNNAPTGQGLTDKANLISAGWTVTTKSGNSAFIFGTSITYGLYVTEATRYSTLYCAADSLVEYNYGVNGKKLMQDPTTPTGTSMYETMSLIPAKPNHATYLILEFGANDYTYFPTYDDDFISDYEAIIDYAINTGGWSADNIKLLTPYLNCDGFDFNLLKTAIQSVGTSKGVQVIDTATDLYNGGDYSGYMVECVHPNTAGHAEMASYIDANIVAP